MSAFRQPALYLGILIGFVIGCSPWSRSEEPRRVGLSLEIYVGQCRYGEPPDGMMWQREQEHANSFKDDRCGKLGIAGRLNPAYTWALRYVNLGRVRMDSLAVTCPEDDCTKVPAGVDTRRAECSKSQHDNCLTRWKSGGGIKGVELVIGTELARLGLFSLEGTLGLFAYQIKYQAQIYPLDCLDQACAWRGKIDQKTGYYLTPAVGLGVRYPLTERTSVSFGTDYYLRTSQHVPISAGMSGPAQTWQAGLRMEF